MEVDVDGLCFELTLAVGVASSLSA